MDFGKLPLLTMFSKRLSWLGNRQTVLAQNIANADTPGYRAKDLKPQTFKEILGGNGSGGNGGVTLSATRPGHLGTGLQGRAERASAQDTDEISISGNSVDLEDQTMRVTQTGMDHQLTVNIYRKHIAMIKTALGRPGG